MYPRRTESVEGSPSHAVDFTDGSRVVRIERGSGLRTRKVLVGHSTIESIKERAAEVPGLTHALLETSPVGVPGRGTLDASDPLFLATALNLGAGLPIAGAVGLPKTNSNRRGVLFSVDRSVRNPLAGEAEQDPVVTLTHRAYIDPNLYDLQARRPH